MAGAIEIMNSVRNIANRWINTQQPLTVDAFAGDTTITIRNTNRFQVGDEIMIRDPINGGEINNVIAEIVDDTNVRLTEELISNWTVDQSATLQKIFDGQMLQGVYMGEPDNIPMYPAITVHMPTRESEWLTIDSTKEVYRAEISIYTKAAAQEKGYRNHIRIAETMIYGLKKNIYPLVSPYRTSLAIADIAPGDVFIKVADTSNFVLPSRVIIEDEWKQAEIILNEIVDANTIKVRQSPGCSFLVSDNTQIINTDRFIFNSWPESVTYGEVYKGSLLKSAKISWFAWEELIWRIPPRETQLH